MFPVGLLPFPLDSALIANILSNLLFLNPTTVLLTGVFLLSLFSLKTLTAKLTFIAISMLVSSSIMYVIYKKDIKEQKKKQCFLDYDASQVSEATTETKELALSKLFKK